MSVAPSSSAGTSHTGIPVTFSFTQGALALLGAYTAQYLGFFERYGIIAKRLTSATGTVQTQLIVTGQAQFGISDLTQVTTINAAGADLRVLMGQIDRFPAALVCRNGVRVGKYPGGMKDLEGLKVGISAPGSSTDSYLRYTMIVNGADPDKAEIVPLGGVPQYIAAIKAKAVDCAVAYEPIQTQVKADVYEVVSWAKGEGPAVYANWTHNVIVTTRSFAAQNPEAVRRVRAAMTDAIRYTKDPKNTEVLASVLSPEFPGVPLDQLASMIANTQPAFGTAPEITAEKLANEEQVYKVVTGKEIKMSVDELMVKLP